MTKEQYYKALSELRPPATIPNEELDEWFTPRIIALRKKLSFQDLKEILGEQERFEDKMQSSIS